jgi:hypothetical protein
MPLKELEDKISRFDQELQGLGKERELSLLLLDGRIKGVIGEVEADLDAFKKETIIKLRRKMEESFHQKSQAAGDLRKETEEILFNAAERLHHLAAGNRETLPKIGRYSRGIREPHQYYPGSSDAIDRPYL